MLTEITSDISLHEHAKHILLTYKEYIHKVNDKTERNHHGEDAKKIGQHTSVFKFYRTMSKSKDHQYTTSGIQ